LEEGEDHGVRQKRLWTTKEANGFMRKTVHQGLLEGLPSSARFGLLLIPREALQTVAGKISTYYGEACFAPLLGFVIKSKANLFDEGRKVRVRMAELP